MNPAILNLVLQLVQLAISEIPELIQAEQTIVSLITSGADPTPAQLAQIDAAYQLVSAKLDAKLAADLDTPPKSAA